MFTILLARLILAFGLELLVSGGVPTLLPGVYVKGLGVDASALCDLLL